MSTPSALGSKPATPWTHLAVGLFGLLFSALTLLHLGRLGFQFEDLSIPFDGGYRIAMGQRPYVDFMAPNGPVLFVQQALFFKLFGVSLAVYLWHAAVLNALAGVMVWRLVAHRGVWIAGVSTLATWCWFYLPPAAPYIDTNAFFWTLTGFWALAEGRRRFAAAGSASRSLGWLVLAGTAASLAALSKQNIGALAMAGLGLLLWLDLRDHPRHRPWRDLAGFAFGLAVPWLLLAAYLTWSGGWPGFLHYVWDVPAASGRLKMLLPWSARMLIKVIMPDAVNSTLAYMLGPALRELMVYGLSAWLAWRWWRREPATHGFWLVGGIFLLLQQQWSYNTSNNNESLYWPYAGLLWGLLGPYLFGFGNGTIEGEAATTSRSLRPTARTLAGRPALVVALGLCLAAAGGYVGATRQVHDLRPAHLGPALQHPQLSGLRLYPDEGRDFAALVQFLETNVDPEASYLVLGDAGVLYGITGHRPPPGLLWYRDGVSYLATDNDGADALLSAVLDRPEVTWVVVDGTGQKQLLDDFPAVRKQLDRRFLRRHEIGVYELFGR